MYSFISSVTYFFPFHSSTLISFYALFSFSFSFSLLMFVFTPPCSFSLSLCSFLWSTNRSPTGLLSCHYTPVLWLKKVHGPKRLTNTKSMLRESSLLNLWFSFSKFWCIYQWYEWFLIQQFFSLHVPQERAPNTSFQHIFLHQHKKKTILMNQVLNRVTKYCNSGNFCCVLKIFTLVKEYEN